MSAALQVEEKLKESSFVWLDSGQKKRFDRSLQSLKNELILIELTRRG